MALKVEDIHKMNIEALGISAVEFITGKDYYLDIKPLVESFCEVRGWLMTEQEQVSNFITKNEVEILNQMNDKFGKFINLQNNLTTRFAQKQNNYLFQNFSATNDWDFYYNPQNISNQSFVLETEQYFETGARKGFLEPLVFMKLFWEQLQYFIKNAHKPHSTLKHFESLLLTAEQKHVLYCFILKYYGGYPLTVSTIDVEQRQPALFLILEAFLRYEGDTPEKEYCRNIDQPKNLNDKLISLEPLPESYQYTAKDFEGFAANNDWDFYHNLDNIRQQEHFIFPIKKYFQAGERAGFIEPLAFMNLYWEQLMKLLESQNSTRSFTDSLKTLPINEEVRHVLYGWLLKYAGGFPYKHNNLWYDVIFIKIGNAFESYEGKTPEKWFCLSEDEREKKISEGIAILDARIEKEKNGAIDKSSSQIEDGGKQKVETSRIKNLIEEEFKTVGKIGSKGWEYAFTSKQDYNTFVELLANYFEKKPYNLPDKPIQLKRDCKTQLAKILNPIHQSCSNNGIKLRSDTEFFLVVKVLSHFKDLSDDNIYKAITR